MRNKNFTQQKRNRNVFMFSLIHCFSLVTTGEMVSIDFRASSRDIPACIAGSVDDPEEKEMTRILPFILICVIMATNVEGGQKQRGPEEWILEAEEALANIDSYTAVFHKQERVKGWLKAEEVVFLKFKKPFKVYMRWLKDPGKGREVVYADGWRSKPDQGPGILDENGFQLQYRPSRCNSHGGQPSPDHRFGVRKLFKAPR